MKDCILDRLQYSESVLKTEISGIKQQYPLLKYIHLFHRGTRDFQTLSSYTV